MNEKPILAFNTFSKYVRDDRDISWPDSSKERMQLARALYGKQLIHTFDYWLKHAIDLLENSTPSEEPIRRTSKLYRQEKYFRDRLATLSPEQRQTVRHLILTLAHGLLFGSLVDIDQGDYGEFILAMKPKEAQTGKHVIQIAPDVIQELHDELDDWILSFSQFADEITELVPIKGGWQFQRKEYDNS
jgi:hypothetical protein